MRITQKHILNTINQLPDDTTIEEALEIITVLSKIDSGLQENQRMSQQGS